MKYTYLAICNIFGSPKTMPVYITRDESKRIDMLKLDDQDTWQKIHDDISKKIKKSITQFEIYSFIEVLTYS